ncbi:MAG: hypothetical protein P1U89_13070 [Verrucomicrobiales bacterium]|nr:hypothetical protein [Verrucomicrobiales bacterium]
MKILSFAFTCVLVSGFFAGNSQAYDLAKMTTKTGKVYREVRIIDADKHGLLFRHAGGIAKESFPFLSNNIRDMFEPVGEIPAADAPKVAEKGDAKAQAVKNQVYIPDVTLTLLIRQPVAKQPNWYCQMHPNPLNWPSHWHRFHSAHYLTNPICRAAVTRQFLQDTGLLPHADGRIYHHWPSANSIRFW